MLEVYARAFSSVEVDSTFYAIPSIASVDAWNKRTPPGFTFALKLPQAISHEAMLKAPSIPVLDEFCDRVRILDKKLACVLIQMPPNFDGALENRQSLERFLPYLPRDIRFAIEFRNRDWLDHNVMALLKDFGVACALVHGQWLRDSDIRFLSANLTADFTYVRWMGARDLTRFDIVQRPQDANLARWASLLRYLEPKLSDIYAYFSNFYEGHSPESANKLQKLLGQDVIEPSELDDQPSLFA
jgi:uncharacterized protein YecE (DUF72 family)